MKKIYALAVIAIVAFTGSANAQSQRLVLAEEFTQASCGPCAAQNPTFNTLLANNTAKVVGIKYQTNWPGVDPMNTQTQTWVGPRVTYYAVNGVPHATMDGTAQTGGSYTGAPANWTQAKIDTRYAVASPFDLEVSHTFDASYANVDITVDITATQAAAGTLYLRVALVEQDIEFCQAPGTNGETEFYGVMRKMLPNATGTALATSWTAGQTQQLTFSSAIPSYIYDLKQFAIVVFIQNDVNKEVLQAGLSAPQPIALDASIKDCSLASASVTCGNTMDPSITISNEGTTAITTVDLTYSVTGGVPQNYTANVNIAPGANSTVILPSITMATFPSTFTCTVTAVNGTTDIVAGNNTSTTTIYQIPGAAQMAPVTQDFVAAVFPPANWTRINGGGTATWTRVSQGASANNGSAKMDFYNSAQGDEDYLYSPKVDMSGLTNPVLTFKIAKAQYTGFIDRMDIHASIDCGATWTTVWTKSDPLLSTMPAQTGAYTPISGNAAHWRNENVDLSAFAGQTEVLFVFDAISGYGNNMYVDDINVQSAVGIGENPSTSISVFPSITTGDVYVNLSGVQSKSNVVSIFDVNGKLVNTFNASIDNNSQIYVNMASYQNGMYIIQVETGSQKIVEKIMLEK